VAFFTERVTLQKGEWPMALEGCKERYKVNVIVEVRAGPGAVGVSASSVIVGEDYQEDLLAARAVKQFRAAKANMLERLAAKRAADARQAALFV
jgi:hypothetical protein